MIRITLPYPPSANRYWRNVNGRMVRSAEASAYKSGVEFMCLMAHMEPLEGAVCISLDFYRPAKRGDLDNLLKVVLDSLIGWAYVDDAQVVEIHALRHDNKEDPRVEIVVSAVE